MLDQTPSNQVTDLEALAKLISIGREAFEQLESLVAAGNQDALLQFESLNLKNSLRPKISVLYTGSFDPFTLGHRDIVERATKLFDQVIIAIGINPEKKSTFSQTERIELIQADTQEFGNKVKVVAYRGAAIDKARKEGATFLIRGVRETTDFVSETKIAMSNREQSKNTVETLFFPSDPVLSHVSSSMAKEYVKLDFDTNKYLTRNTARQLQRKLFEPLLKQQWSLSCQGLSIPENPDTNAAFTKIVDAYCGMDRHYHDIRHLYRMFKTIEAFNPAIEDRAIFNMAILFHDLVYLTKHLKGENETLSAEAGATFLRQHSVDEKRIANFNKLVLATSGHKAEQGNPDQSLFLDLDLSILATDIDRYFRYADDIRAEFSKDFTDAEMNEKRPVFLQNFLKRDPIFNNPELIGISENDARENIQREILRLQN